MTHIEEIQDEIQKIHNLNFALTWELAMTTDSVAAHKHKTQIFANVNKIAGLELAMGMYCLHPEPAKPESGQLMAGATFETIAKVCHEAKRVWLAENKIETENAWDELTTDEKENAIANARYRTYNAYTEDKSGPQYEMRSRRLLQGIVDALTK